VLYIIQNKKIKKVIYFISIIITFLFLTATVYRIEFNNLCLLCHKPNKDRAFKNETHPASVKCYDCHLKEGTPFLEKLIAPHKTFTNKQSIINKNCTKCHQLKQYEDTTPYKFNLMQINITHKNHLEKYEADCLNCHLNVEHTKLKPKSNRPPMNSCEECHQKNMNQCLLCHQLKTLPKPLSEDIEENECIKCHTGFETKDIKYHKFPYSHKKHKEAGLSCDRCHFNQYEHGILIITESDCLICHSLDENIKE